MKTHSCSCLGISLISWDCNTVFTQIPNTFLQTLKANRSNVTYPHTFSLDCFTSNFFLRIANISWVHFSHEGLEWRKREEKRFVGPHVYPSSAASKIISERKGKPQLPLELISKQRAQENKAEFLLLPAAEYHANLSPSCGPKPSCPSQLDGFSEWLQTEAAFLLTAVLQHQTHPTLGVCRLHLKVSR